ncbi:hypothetical protein MUP59_00615 [Candidatus Bathyarchaeota archaeon]|nr:hypothetical protein [Candidatus Bathyarchaeota archaeon]
MNRDNVYKQLFERKQENPTMDTAKEAQALLTLMASASVTEDSMRKLYILRLVGAIAVRLSLIASVWVFLFNPNLWYGMPLFLILTILFGGIMDRKFIPKE